MARVRGILLGLVLLVLLAVAGAAWWGWQQLDAPGPATAAVDFEVRSGMALATIARRLEAAGVLRHARLFEWYGRGTDQAGRIRAGEYRFPAGSTPRQVMARLVSGEVLLHSLTIVEGWTFRQMRAAIASHPVVETTLAEIPDDEIMARLGRPGDHPEGWFLPETYRFPRGTTDLELMRIAHEAMGRALEAAWAERRADLPLATPYEALILASIIEKESALAAERPEIAGVFVRRLELGMRLQTDPTVLYGLGAEAEGRLRRVHLDTDTPYNTYTRGGLPPTPIALPGRESLAAAVQPHDGRTLYFVATGRPDGSHHFSATLEEHNRAVQRYLQVLRARRSRE
ncbi:MAG TPA: endolytic transglycosylase MltG [Gammaproteobacteria bacterium]|nr:endolytic transglycosylase MltG [Gammaproteobacteria bacterium]